MTTYVTVNLFDVFWNDEISPRLAEVLDEYSGIPLDRRWRGDLRLENIDHFPPDDVVNSDYYALNFVKKRSIGPGKVASNIPVADIELDIGEQFGEETAALYLPAQRWLLILNNKHGIGPSRMAEYFNALDPGNAERHFDYTVAPCIDRHVLQRMERMRNLTSVEVVASVGAFENSGDVGESVEQVAEASRAMRLSLKLDANEERQRGNFLNLDSVMPLINSLLRRGEDVKKIDVKGSEDAETRDEIIHLIEHKIRVRRNASELLVVNHRYTHTSKIDLLKRVCRGWIIDLT
jgi:hypothetical protein